MRGVVVIHVLVMFLAVALSYGTIVLLWVAARSRDVDGLRGISRSIGRLQRVVAPTYMLGIVLGIVAIFANGFNPTAGWLIAAYILTAVAIISASAIVAPWLKRVDAELAVPGSSDTVPAAFSDRRALPLLVLDAGVIVALIADMILKPF
jgi:hypothetical protein